MASRRAASSPNSHWSRSRNFVTHNAPKQAMLATETATADCHRTSIAATAAVLAIRLGTCTSRTEEFHPSHCNHPSCPRPSDGESRTRVIADRPTCIDGGGEHLGACRRRDHLNWPSSRMRGWSLGRGRVESDHSGDGREIDDCAMLAVWCVVGDDCSTAPWGDRSNGPGSSARSEISRSDRWRPLGFRWMVAHVRAPFEAVTMRCSLNGGRCSGSNRVDIAGVTRSGAAQGADHRSDARNGRQMRDARVSWPCDPGEPPVACRPVRDVHVSRSLQVGNWPSRSLRSSALLTSCAQPRTGRVPPTFTLQLTRACA